MDFRDNFYLLSQQTVTHLPLPTIEEVWSAIHGVLMNYVVTCSFLPPEFAIEFVGNLAWCK